MAFAQGGLRPDPDRSDFQVQWYRQESGAAARDWEIEIKPFRSDYPTYRTREDAFRNASCWALEVPGNEPALVRVREIIGNQSSTWSEYSVVPEPSSRLALPLPLVLLAGLATRRRHRCQARRAERGAPVATGSKGGAS